jgi:hypothetical protein
LWQLISHEEPFADLNQIEAATAAAMEHKRPPFPSETPFAVKKLVEGCWDESPNRRPSFDDIAKILDVLRKVDLSDDEKRWLEAPLGHPVYKTKRPKMETIPPTDLHSTMMSNLDLAKKPKPRKFGLFSRKSTQF